MPPLVLVYRAGRCWSLPFPRLELPAFISQGDGYGVSALPIPILGLAKNYYSPCGGAAKSLPLPVSDNIHLRGGRQTAPPASLILTLPFPSFSIFFFSFFLAAQRPCDKHLPGSRQTALHPGGVGQEDPPLLRAAPG